MRRSSILSETRTILALAWPVVLTGLNWTVLHVTDVIVVGLVDTDSVAALAASRALTFITIVTGLAWLSGILAFASRADGAGDLKGTGTVLHEGMVLALILGGLLGGVLLLFAEPLLRLVGVSEALVPGAGRVVRVMALGYPCQMVMIAASFFLEGISRPRRVTAVNLAIMPFNAVVAWGLAAGHFGLAPLGAVGAAMATTLASVVGAVLMVGAAWTLPRAAERGLHDFGPAAWRGVPAGAWRLATFGIVPAIASGLELAGFSVLIALSTQLGDVSAHAFQIVFSVHNVTFAIALGIGSAAGVRAGNAVGEGQPAAAVSRTLIAVGLTVSALGILATLLVAAAPWLVAIFPATAPVHALARTMLPIWAPFIVFDGIQVVLVYALRSLGDQVAAGINSILAYFVVTGGAGLWFVHHGAGGMGLVYASALGMMTAAVLNGSRFGVISGRLRRQS
jgi:MATE family multidrug resistance protein